MKFRKCISVVITLLLIIPALLTAKQDKPMFGFYGGIQSFMHSNNFSNLPGLISCCNNFQKSSGTGLFFGGLYQFGISDKSSIALRLGYSAINGTFEKNEIIGNVYDLNMNTTNADAAFKLENKLGLLEFSPIYILHPFEFPLRFNLGLQAGFIMSGSFDYMETIQSPANVYYLNGLKTQTSSGDINDISQPFLALSAGISYEFVLSKTIIISPEIDYSYNLTKMVKDKDWQANSFRLGLAIKYKSAPPPPAAPQNPPVPELPKPPLPEKSKLTADISAVGLDDKGNETSIKQLHVQEFLSRSLHPLLNYIFFDHGESFIPDRYKKLNNSQTNAFSDDNFANQKTIDVYYQILNIVGHRMKKYPSANLIITGCNSDLNTEKGNKSLSRKRADEVKRYLTDIWQIDPARIKTEARNLPEFPSNSTDANASSENSRVELKSDFIKIFEPVTIRDTLVESSPSHIRFKPVIKSEAGVSEWNIETRQQGYSLKVFSGKGNPPASLNWILADEYSILPRYEGNIEYALSVKDEENNIFSTSLKQIPVEAFTTKNKYLAIDKGQKVDDKEFDVFSLMSFGFNSSELNKQHHNMIELAKKRITKQSKVEIKGYTDNLGDEEHNLVLSQKRALATAKALGIAPEYSKGIGEAEPLFNNELPEGRFYNRSVYIIIETTFDLK